MCIPLQGPETITVLLIDGVVKKTTQKISDRLSSNKLFNYLQIQKDILPKQKE
jgi:hypothetical protein